MSQSGYQLLSPVANSKQTKTDHEKVSTHYSVLEDGEASGKAEGTGRCPTTKKRYLAIAFAFVVLATVVVVTTVLTTGSTYLQTTRRAATSRKFSFDDIFNGKYSAKHYSCHWVSDTSYIHRAWDDALRLYNLESNTSEVIATADLLNQNSASDDYSLSPDKDWLLLACNKAQLYRHSFFADYIAYNIKSKITKKIKPPYSDGKTKIRYAGWGPKGNSLVIVFKNDIYYKDNVRSQSFYRITSDGKDKVLFNGVPDWVYEEEILGSTHALKFSPDGKYLAYGTFNASNVPYYKFTRYGANSEAYTMIEKIAYPKAGYPNPTVALYVVNLDAVKQSMGRKTTAVKLLVPDRFKNGDHYYTVLQWASKNQVYVNWMNRAQDETISVIYDTETGKSKQVEKHSVKNGWVDDDYVKPSFSSKGQFYITMLPQKIGSHTFRHIAKVRIDTPDRKDPEFLTSGEWDVGDISCFDSVNERIFYRSGENNPSTRHLYYVDVKNPKSTTCITCGLNRDCAYYVAQMSKGCQWVNLMCQGPGIPQTKLRNLKKGTEIILELNQGLREDLRSKDLSTTVQYKVMSDGYSIAVKERRPYHFDPQKKYAVLFDVYGGPGTQKVSDGFEIYFSEFLVSNYDIIIVNTDARGSGMYGDDFKHAVFKRLGYYEARDNINVARELQRRSYVDPNRIAVWGWSYGGFLSSTILATGNNVIRCGIAVAPVTDWRYYDTVYSERYMGLPTKSDNLAGYEKTSIIPFAKNFSNSKYLLVHGTADDNVHFQNSAHLAYALSDNEIQFRTQFYTDKTHGITGVRSHLFKLLTTFLEQSLNLQRS